MGGRMAMRGPLYVCSAHQQGGGLQRAFIFMRAFSFMRGVAPLLPTWRQTLERARLRANEE